MKILFITRRYNPSIGGVEKHVEKIAGELLLQGHEITVITHKYNKNLKATETLNGIKIIRFEFPSKKIIGLLQIWYWMIKNITLLKKSNIIHVHDVMIWLFPIKLIKPKLKIYLTMHGWEGEYPIPLKNIILKKISNKLAHKTILVGKFIEKYYDVHGDKIIFGAVDIPKKKESKKEGLVYVGRLNKDTGLPILLAALEQNKKIKADFVGDGPLRKTCEMYGQVHGFTDPQPFLSKSKICYVSGYLTILEALANGCQVISAFDNSLRKDYLKMSPFKNWIKITNSSNEISDLIYQNQGNPNQTPAEAKYWLKKQTWQNLVVEYLDLWS